MNAARQAPTDLLGDPDDPEVRLAAALDRVGAGNIEALAWSQTELPERYIGDPAENLLAQDPYPMASLARAILRELERAALAADPAPLDAALKAADDMAAAWAAGAWRESADYSAIEGPYERYLAARLTKEAP